MTSIKTPVAYFGVAEGSISACGARSHPQLYMSGFNLGNARIEYAGRQLIGTLVPFLKPKQQPSLPLPF